MQKFKIHLTGCSTTLEFESVDDFIRARDEEVEAGNGFISYVETLDDNGNVISTTSLD
ncbi:hypothetical protein [Vibrio fluvialis]|uniref:hypothetical protein n=1 Tax=Vibrio fluvialis TaxID=676 RepID=UPI0023A93853|nr:hypothetical protein [Vibrio fluvialis]MDE5179113.1 hypothetical protein [Vibrio fluvialis]